MTALAKIQHTTKIRVRPLRFGQTVGNAMAGGDLWNAFSENQAPAAVAGGGQADSGTNSSTSNDAASFAAFLNQDTAYYAQNAGNLSGMTQVASNGSLDGILSSGESFFGQLGDALSSAANWVGNELEAGANWVGNEVSSGYNAVGQALGILPSDAAVSAPNNALETVTVTASKISGMIEPVTVTSDVFHRSDTNGAGLAITDAERILAAKGDVEGYYKARLTQGDPVAGIGLASLHPPGGLLDYLFGGASVNNRLEAFSRVYAGHSADTNAIRIDLMNAEIKAIDGDPTGNGLLSPGQVYDYHVQVFQKYGLPPTAFGGSPMTGERWEAYATAPIWYGASGL